MEKINYNSETKEQVIKQVLRNEKSANQIAKELGIVPNSMQVSVATKNLFFVMTKRSCGRNKRPYGRQVSQRLLQGTQPAELPRGAANPQGLHRGTRSQEQGTGETPEETRKGAGG